MNSLKSPNFSFFQNGLFIGFLVFGLLSGSLIGQFSKAKRPKSSARPMQENILVALVEDASAESSPLIGLWLAAIPDQNIEINWMPIFPLPLLDNSNGGESIQNQIIIESSVTYSWERLASVRNSGVSWDQVIITDVEAFDILFKNGSNSSVDQLSNPSKKSQKAFYEQVSLIEQFCQFRPEKLVLENLLALLEDGGHLKSTFSSFEIIGLWDQFFLGGNQMECQHPWAN